MSSSTWDPRRPSGPPSWHPAAATPNPQRSWTATTSTGGLSRTPRSLSLPAPITPVAPLTPQPSLQLLPGSLQPHCNSENEGVEPLSRNLCHSLPRLPGQLPLPLFAPTASPSFQDYSHHIAPCPSSRLLWGRAGAARAERLESSSWSEAPKAALTTQRIPFLCRDRA